VDQIGSWSYGVVLMVYVYERTHSPTWIAVIAASRWAVGLLLSGFAGTIADRYERTRVMLASALGSGVIMSGIAVAIGIDAPVVTLVPLAMLSAVASTPYRPAAGALVPVVVDERDLAAANAMFAAIENLVIVIGPAIGGLLLAVGAPVDGVILNAASYFLDILLILRLKVRSTGSVAAGEAVWSQWLAGFRLVAKDQSSLALVVFAALDSSVYGAATVIFAPLSVRLGTGVNGYSYLLVGGALGGVIAAGLANRLSERIRLAPVIAVSIVVQATPFALTAATHTPVVAFLLQVASGAGMVVVDVLAITALQRQVANEALSRVLSAFDAAVTAAILAATFAVSAVLSSSGVVTALLLTGLGVPALAALLLPLVLRADRSAIAAVQTIRDRVELLERLDLFGGAAPIALERLAGAAEPVSLPARSVVIREGDPADSLWVLTDGSLAVRAKAGRAAARQLPPVTAPGYVGEIGLVQGVPRTASVRTREPSRLLRIDGDLFLDALSTTPPSGSFVQLSGARWHRTGGRRNPPRVAGDARATAIGCPDDSRETERSPVTQT
jgi:MFS family permease